MIGAWVCLLVTRTGAPHCNAHYISYRSLVAIAVQMHLVLSICTVLPASSSLFDLTPKKKHRVALNLPRSRDLHPTTRRSTLSFAGDREMELCVWDILNQPC